MTEMKRSFEYPREMDDSLYRQLVEQVKDFVIYMVDPTGRVMTWNMGGKKIFGYNSEEILGKNFSFLFPHPENAQMLPQRLLQDALRNGKVQTHCRKCDSRGKHFTAEVTITPLYNSSNNFIGFSIITDSTNDQVKEQSVH
jgi:PAS domain S-box-containing protein